MPIAAASHKRSGVSAPADACATSAISHCVTNQNVIKLPGSPSDYQFDVHFDDLIHPTDTLAGTTTVISYHPRWLLTPNIVFNTADVERATFESPVDTSIQVQLTNGSVANEMLKLAVEAYNPKANFFSADPIAYEAGDPDLNLTAKAQNRNWHPVAAMELAGKSPVLIFALGATTAALGVFLVARPFGWIAHAIEQYEAGTLIRPRAR